MTTKWVKETTAYSIIYGTDLGEAIEKVPEAHREVKAQYPGYCVFPRPVKISWFREGWFGLRRVFVVEVWFDLKRESWLEASGATAE